jgi:hypothetical protein
MLVCPVLTGIERGVKPRINFKVLSRHIPLVFRCIIRSQSFNEFRIFRKFCPQGYLIGNPLTDVDYDFNSFVPFAHGMGLISTDMYEVCGFNFLAVQLSASIPKSIDRYNLFQDVKASCRGTFFGAVDDLCQEKIDRVRWVMRLSQEPQNRTH